MKKNFLTLFLVFLLPQNLFAATHHSDDHKQIFHSFALEAEAGRDNNDNAHGWDLDGWIGTDFDRLWLKSEKKLTENMKKNQKFRRFMAEIFHNFGMQKLVCAMILRLTSLRKKLTI